MKFVKEIKNRELTMLRGPIEILFWDFRPLKNKDLKLNQKCERT